MTPMLCFGIVCLSKGDQDSACGPGGTVRVTKEILSVCRYASIAGWWYQHDRYVSFHHRLFDGDFSRDARLRACALSTVLLAGNSNEQLQDGSVLGQTQSLVIIPL